MYSWLYHNLVFGMESNWTPWASTVVAAPIRKLYPANLDASNPASINPSLASCSRDSGRPSLNWKAPVSCQVCCQCCNWVQLLASFSQEDCDTCARMDLVSQTWLSHRRAPGWNCNFLPPEKPNEAGGACCPQHDVIRFPAISLPHMVNLQEMESTLEVYQNSLLWIIVITYFVLLLLWSQGIAHFNVIVIEKHLQFIKMKCEKWMLSVCFWCSRELNRLGR